MNIQSNHSFCVEWALRQGRPVTVLDYGCGGAQIVTALRASGVDAYGCDVFYQGGDYSANVPWELFDSNVIRRMERGSIPFDDEQFDLIINNTVLEHVDDLDAVLIEMSRVLKPGGKLLSLFPQREIWFEWHIGVPFAHWFRPGSRLRLSYVTAMRLIGLGSNKGGKSAAAWSRDAVEWIDRWTHYRPRLLIEQAFARHFAAPFRLEVPWVEHKLNHPAVVKYLPHSMKQRIVETLAGLVFECEKKLDGHPALPAH
jgi:SAM-dependent methyltransferase